MKVVGAVTIGQSPRNDVVPEMAALVPRTRWVETGALDDLNDAAIASLAPRADEFPLVTRLRGGATVTVGRDSIVPLLRTAIGRVEADADLVVLLCSDPFELRSRVPLLLTHGLVDAAVRALRVSRFAILKPHAGQVGRPGDAADERRWRDVGAEPIPIFVPAYGPADLAAAGRAAHATGASAVVMDCFGYALATKRAVAAASGLPTLLVRSLAARMVAELTG